MVMQQRFMVTVLLAVLVGMVCGCGASQPKVGDVVVPSIGMPGYTVLLSDKQPGTGKFVIDLLVPEESTVVQVMTLATSLKQRYAGQYHTICIYDSQEAQQRRSDATYPERELDQHWLVALVEDDGIARDTWVAKGRDH